MPNYFAAGLWLLAVFVLLLLFVADHAEARKRYCEVLVRNRVTRANECPPGMDYELSMNMCCKDTPIYAGQKPTNVGGEKGRRQHNDESCFVAFKVNGVPRCPPGGHYRASIDQCCFPAGTTLDSYPSHANAGSESCVDKHVSGRPSDCPANEHKCNDPLWRDLMTEQCPKTCGHCGTGTTRTSCVDGVGKDGKSECPMNKHLCTHPIYSDFMRLECRLTCGYCSRQRSPMQRTPRGRRH